MSNVSGLGKCWSDLDCGIRSTEKNTLNATDIQKNGLGLSEPQVDLDKTDFFREIENKGKNPKILAKELSLNLQFDDLPDELIMEILSFIPLKELCLTIPLVCKKWKDFALSPLLWQHLDFSETKYLNTEAFFDIISCKCPLLKRLSLRCRGELSEYQLLNIAKVCPLLQQLSLAFCSQINKEMVARFAKYCPDLQDINLEGCDITDDCLNDLTVLPLKKISVSHCVHLSDDGLKTLTTKCNYLQSINFDGIQWITDDAVFVMVDHCYKNLEKLWLDGANLTDPSVKEIIRCKKLKVFSLSFCDNLSDAVLTWIKEMKTLQMLRLKKGVNFSAKALQELFIGLHVNSMENTFGILHLHLPECSNMDDKAVIALAESFPNLLVLDLSWCWDITDQGLRHVILNCNLMQSMIICGLREIMGDCLIDLPRLMPNLKYLDATQCNKMSDEMLLELVNIVPNITVINYYCEKLQPESTS